jgi:hypothetical protein
MLAKFCLLRTCWQVSFAVMLLNAVLDSRMQRDVIRLGQVRIVTSKLFIELDH